MPLLPQYVSSEGMRRESVWVQKSRKLSVISRLASKRPITAPSSAPLDSRVHAEDRAALLEALSKEHAQRSPFDLFTIQAWLRMVKLPANIRRGGSSNKGSSKSPRRQKEDSGSDLGLDYPLMIACMRFLPKAATHDVLAVQGDPDANLHILVSGACGVYRVVCEGGVAFEPEPEYSPTFSAERCEAERAFVLRRMRKQRAMERGLEAMTSPTVLTRSTSRFRPAPLPWRAVYRDRKLAKANKARLRTMTSFRAQRLGRVSGADSQATPNYRVPWARMRSLGSRIMLGRMINRHSLPPAGLSLLDRQQQAQLDQRLLDAAHSSAPVDRAATLVAARVRGVSQRNLLATKQEAAIRIEALVRGQRQRARLQLNHEASTKLAAFARGAAVRRQDMLRSSAATCLQAHGRGMCSRASIARRRQAAAANPPLVMPNLQVRRTGTLMELSWFNASCLLAPSKSDAIVVCDYPSELVVLDARRYRELRIDGVRSTVDRKASVIRSLPVFQEAATNAIETAISTARRLAVSQALSRGLSKEEQLVAGNSAAEEAAVAAAARTVDDLRGLASNLKESSFEVGEHASLEGAADLLLLVTTGQAVLTAKDGQRQHSLTLLALGPGGLCSISELAEISSISNPVLSGTPCTCLWFDGAFVTQVLGQHVWNLMLAQASATTQRVVMAARGFAEATAPAPAARGIPPDPDTWWRNGPPSCTLPLFAVSDEQLISKRPEPIELTEKEVEAARERLARLRILKQSRPKEEPASWADLIPSNGVNRPSVWRCRWCDCDAELGKGLGPEGGLSLCFDCSRSFMAGRKDAPGSRPSQHNAIYACSRCSKRFVAVETLQEHISQCKVGLERGQPGWRCCWCRCGENEANGIERGPRGKTLCSLCAVKWRAGQHNPAPVELDAAPRNASATRATPLRQANTASSAPQDEPTNGRRDSTNSESDAVDRCIRSSTGKPSTKLTEVKMSHHSLAEVELSASGRLPPREKTAKFDYLFVKPKERLSIYAEAQLEARALTRTDAGEARGRGPTSPLSRDATLPQVASATASPILSRTRHHASLSSFHPASPTTPVSAQLAHRHQQRPYSMTSLGRFDETSSPMMLNSRGTIDLRRPRSAAALPFRASARVGTKRLL